MKNFRLSIMIFAMMFLFGLVSFVSAASEVNLGTANNFVILAGSAITNTGSSIINGDLGLSPGTAVTGFPPAVVNGTQHIADATSVLAKTDLVAAFNSAGQTPVITVPTELGGTTKTAGIYDSTAGTFSITGTLTLDAQGDSNAVFIFKSNSTLITAGSSSIVLINGAQACNIFWQVGSSATLGVNSSFKGNILALTSITLTTGANVEGRVLAQNGAVTLDGNVINKAVCIAPVVIPTPIVTSTPIVTPIIIPIATATPILISEPAITSTPTLPATGIAPDLKNTSPWVTITFILTLSMVVFTYLVFKKRTI